MNELTWECILAEILIMDVVVGWYSDTLNQGLMYQLNAVTIIPSDHNWLVVWNNFYFSIWFETFFIFPYIGNNHLNWRTHIFKRGRSTTNQIVLQGHTCLDFPWHPWGPRTCLEKPKVQIPINIHRMPLKSYYLDRNTSCHHILIVYTQGFK